MLLRLKTTRADCVGCEKCRLWGKLQFLGLGTAMKILFADDATPDHPSNLRLSRNEVVALLNVLHRLSMSLAAIDVFRELEAQRALHRVFIRVCMAGVVVLVTCLGLWLRRHQPSIASTTKSDSASDSLQHPSNVGLDHADNGKADRAPRAKPAARRSLVTDEDIRSTTRRAGALLEVQPTKTARGRPKR